MATSQRARLTLDLEPEIRRRLRIAAVQRDTTLNEYVRLALARQLDEDLPPGILAVDDPVLSEVWDNDADDVYDEL